MEAEPITSLSLDELAETERLESELDSFIEKRAREAKDAQNVANLWLKSEREHREKRRQRNGWGWIRHYEGLAHAHRTLAAENASKADHVRGLLGLEVLPEPSKNGRVRRDGLDGHVGRATPDGQAEEEEVHDVG